LQAFNIWGINPDNLPDQSIIFGDVDGDGILDRVPPISLLKNNISLASPPRMPYLSYKLALNDSTLGYTIAPSGSAWYQLAMYILMALIPPLTGTVAVLLFRKSFYGVKHNYIGVEDKESVLRAMIPALDKMSAGLKGFLKRDRGAEAKPSFSSDDPLAGDIGSPNRRKVLIATMEYDIEDWNIKIKIGGLGVMASLSMLSLVPRDEPFANTDI
jgi:alpha-1,3-glucan synthase